jgi:hypothetical protein
LSPYRGVTLVYLPEPLDGGYRALVLRSRGPETGEPVYAVGYAVGDLRLSFAVGTVFHDRPYESDAGTDLEHEVWFDITLVAGMSGGAIVDGDGRLVSLVQGTWRSPLTSTGLAFGPQTQALRKVVRGR